MTGTECDVVKLTLHYIQCCVTFVPPVFFLCAECVVSFPLSALQVLFFLVSVISPHQILKLFPISTFRFALSSELHIRCKFSIGSLPLLYFCHVHKYIILPH